jgi:hypothetical protein
LSCDVGEYLNPNNNHECLSSCSSNFIGENNECYSLCNRTKYPYIIEYSNEKGKYVSSCANYGKYYKLDNNICKDTCDFGDGNQIMNVYQLVHQILNQKNMIMLIQNFLYNLV